MVGLLLVHRPGLDGLGQELVHPVGGLERPGLACLALAAQLEPLGDFDLEKRTVGEY